MAKLEDFLGTMLDAFLRNDHSDATVTSLKEQYEDLKSVEDDDDFDDDTSEFDWDPTAEDVTVVGSQRGTDTISNPSVTRPKGDDK